tara:strand:+ start:305 stop:646 length:342 start_codon:yes stop_codon:yes gene_type:complete
LKNWFYRIIDWFTDEFMEWLSVYGTIHIWILLMVSLGGNIYQYSFYKGYDKNVSFVVDAYEVEQLENFDLNRAIHEKNLIIFELDWKLKDCISMVEMIEDEGLVIIKHTLEDD